MINISILENTKTKKLEIEFHQGVSKEEILEICKTLNKEQLQSLFDTQGFHDTPPHK